MREAKKRFPSGVRRLPGSHLDCTHEKAREMALYYGHHLGPWRVVSEGRLSQWLEATCGDEGCVWGAQHLHFHMGKAERRFTPAVA